MSARIQIDHLPKEDSYAKRRELFKDIWETAMTSNEKDANNLLNKPKIIKTLRMGSNDQVIIGKTKKQRIKNLRTVCRKILDICDKQEAEDTFFEQIVKDQKLPQKRRYRKHKTKKIPEANSVFQYHPTPTSSRNPRLIISDPVGKSKLTALVSRNTSPIAVKRTSLLKTKKEREELELSTVEECPGDASAPRRRRRRRKVMRKKQIISEHLF